METVVQTEEEAKQRSIYLKVYDFLSSVKLAVVLFFLLAIGSILGTVIEQGLTPQEYIIRYGETWYYWFKLFNLSDAYHSWWFSLLMALLAINLAVCLSKRLPFIWRTYRTVGSCDFTHNLVLNFKNNTVIQFNGSIEGARHKVESVLKGRKYKIWSENSPGNISIFAVKGAIGRLGSPISHISIFLILMGAVLSSATGFRGFHPFYEGESVYMPNGNFYLFLDKFWIDYYENGRVKDYYSKLTVIDNDEKVMTKTIQVNDPLQYKGVWFYQSSYGTAWDRIDKAYIRVIDKQSGEVASDETFDFRKEKTIEGTGLQVTVTNFVSHFAYDTQSKQVYAKSGEHENPAVQLEIVEDGELISTPWIFYDQRFQKMFTIEKSKYDFVLTGYTAPQYSGLQVAKDPGVNLVWVGSVMLMVGLFVSFFIFHRRLWVKIIHSEESVLIYIGGISNKDTYGFKKEMKDIVESF